MPVSVLMALVLAAAESLAAVVVRYFGAKTTSESVILIVDALGVKSPTTTTTHAAVRYGVGTGSEASTSR
jgi:hypothetical protein